MCRLLDCAAHGACFGWLLRRWTALHWASQIGHTETVMGLLAAGADVHCNTDTGYGAGRCIVGAFREWGICRR